MCTYATLLGKWLHLIRIVKIKDKHIETFAVDLYGSCRAQEREFATALVGFSFYDH